MTYWSRCWEEAFSLSSDHITWSIKDIFPHWFQQSVTLVAFFAAKAIQNDVYALWGDPVEQKRIETADKESYDI